MYNDNDDATRTEVTSAAVIIEVRSLYVSRKSTRTGLRLLTTQGALLEF